MVELAWLELTGIRTMGVMVYPEFCHTIFLEYMYAILIGNIGVFVQWSGLQINPIFASGYNVCCGLTVNLLYV